MKVIIKLILILISLLLLMPVNAMALNLVWNPVTQDPTGAVLPQLQQVNKYTIYRCPLTAPVCNKSTALVIGSVFVPLVNFDITNEPVPSYYFVTASNISGESSAGNLVKSVLPRAVQGSQVVQ